MTSFPRGDEGDRNARETPPQRLRLGWAVAFYAGLAGVAVLWRGAVDGVGPFAAPGVPAPDAAGLAGGALVGLAAGAALVGVSRVWTRFSPAARALGRVLARAVGPLTDREVALLAVSSGIAEELFFRGALQPRVGLVLASVLFALAHLLPRREGLAWAVFALLAGGGFGALFEWSGHVVAPAVAHVVVNAANLRWLAPRPGADGPG